MRKPLILLLLLSLSLMAALTPALATADEDFDAALIKKLEEDPNQLEWTMEDRAYWLSGHGMPGENDITQEEADAKAVAALLDKGVSQAQIDELEMYHYFIAEDAYIEAPYWQVMFMGEGMQLAHTVYVGAQTGDVLRMDDVSSGNG